MLEFSITLNKIYIHICALYVLYTSSFIQILFLYKYLIDFFNFLTINFYVVSLKHTIS